MTEVFVLTSSFDMEGERPKGVFVSQELAKKVAECEAVALGWEPMAWKAVSRLTVEIRFGSSALIVRQERVLDTLPAYSV